MSSSSPNPDKPKQIATKETFGYCSSWCLGGVNVLPLKAQKLQLSA
jgi:hypothetical protein